MATRAMLKPDADAGRLVLSPPRCVGRVRELAALEEALARPPAVVLVEGEAGIGKSRLLREFLASPASRRRRMLLATCPPFTEPSTLGALVDAFRQAADRVDRLALTGLAGALRPLFPEWADDLPPAPEPLEDAAASRHRLFRALVELLGCLDVSVLVVEDIHWADEATLEFLLLLASRQRVSLVVTYRPEDVPAGSALLRLTSRLPAGTTQLRLSLDALDVADTAALVSSMLADESVSAEFAGYLHEQTEGLPLAIEESVRLLRDRRDVRRQHGELVRRHLIDLAVPPTVRDAVVERVRRLSPTTQAVLRAAAVFAYPVPESTLVAMSGLPEGGAVDGLAEALRSGLLGEDRGQLVSFRHVLACRAVYDTTSAVERRGLHRMAGQALEALSPLPVSRLAWHFREAGDTERWCRYGEQAADLALSSGDEATGAVLLWDLVAHASLPAGIVVRLMNKMPLLWFTVDARLQDLRRVLMSMLDAGKLDTAQEAEMRFQLSRVLAAAGDCGLSHFLSG